MTLAEQFGELLYRATSDSQVASQSITCQYFFADSYSSVFGWKLAAIILETHTYKYNVPKDTLAIVCQCRVSNAPVIRSSINILMS